MKSVVVIGSGIAGLSTAFFIQRKYGDALRRGDMRLIVLESSDRIGGNIESVHVDGFVFEAGPRGFLSGGYHTLRIAEEAGVLDKVLVSNQAAKKRYLWFDNRLHLLPTNPIAAMTSPLIGFKTVATVLREYWKRNEPVSDQETVADFFTRRFSKGLVDNLLDPVVSGVYAGNVHRLHAASVFENMVRAEREHGSIIRGMMKNRKSAPAPTSYAQFGRRRLLSFEGGLETLIRAVGAVLKPYLQTGVQISEMARNGSSYRIALRSGARDSVVDADTVIACAPAFRTATLVQKLSPELAASLKAVEYAPMIVVGLGYRNYRHPLDGFGFLAARNQRLTMLGSLWNSSIFPSLSPADSTSITVMLGGACVPEVKEWTDEKILTIVKEEISKTLAIRRDADIVKLFRYDRGIPQYNVGYSSLTETIRRHEAALPGFSLLGNYLGGVGMNDCTKNAFDFVERI